MSLSIKNSKKTQIGQKRQLGQGMTEYIIIVALVAVTAIGVYGLFGKTIRYQVASITAELGGQSGTDLTKKAADTAKVAATDQLINENVTLANYSNSGQELAIKGK